MQSSLPITADADSSWNPEATGHALFATGLGICGVAWGRQGVIALQLPEVDAAATRDRMLVGILRRRPGSYKAFDVLSELPLAAQQAVLGVQALLASPEEATEDPQDGIISDTASGKQESRDSSAAMALPKLLEVELDWHGVSAFHRQVYELTRAIDPGKTRSYGDLAQELGGVGMSRAVGQALGLNPFAPVVPCHRVLTAAQQPGGFSGGGGVLTKLLMLEREGAAWGGSRSLFEGL